MMEVLNIDHRFQPTDEIAATIGFFDGVHAGHQFLLKQLKEQAEMRRLPSMAITFLQFPKSVLQKKSQQDLLNTLDEKIDRLSLSGIDYCKLVNFTQSLSQYKAKDFIQRKLKEEWHVKMLLIGHDHRFGKNRTESFKHYVKYGEDCGMEILHAPELQDFKVSSTKIRNCLIEKKIKEANRMLSYCYQLEGTVIEGNHIGRTIDFPTANIRINDINKIIPGEGTYASWIYWNGRKFAGMVYIGNRPTVVRQGEKRIEAHLFDFSGDLYGEKLRLEFVEFLREEQQFCNTEDLKTQLVADKLSAIKALGEMG